jgi:hypothetical protein
MNAVPAALLSRACRIFLTLAYPGGEETLPGAKRVYWNIDPNQPVDTLLQPPICAKSTAGPSRHGYCFRLGSAHYVHLKMHLIDCDNQGMWVLGVDTHDMIVMNPQDPDAPRLAQLQAANRALKQQIEKAWEGDGLLTFNGLLRRALEAQ